MVSATGMAAALEEADGLVVHNALAARELDDDVAFFLSQLGWDQPLDRIADHLLGGVTENSRRAGVPSQHQAFKGLGDDCVVRRIDDRRQPPGVELRGGLPGDVLQCGQG